MADQGGRRGAGRRQGEEVEGQSTGRKGEGRKEGEGETLYKKKLGVQTPDRPKAVMLEISKIFLENSRKFIEICRKSEALTDFVVAESSLVHVLT